MRPVALALACVAVTGCSMAPAYVRPAPPTAAAYPYAEPSAAGSAAGLEWREFFHDPGLQALIQEALDNNRDLRSAAARVETARAGLLLRRSQLFPSLTGLGLGARAQAPESLSLTGGPTTTDVYLAALSTSWELDFWGRLRSLRDAARENFLASEEARRAVATSLVRQVADSYLLDQEYAERIALAGQTIANRRESLRIARRRYEVGSSSKLGMTQAQALLNQTETALQALEQARAQNADALALLVGRPVPVPLTAGGLSEAAFARDIPAGLPSELLTRRPDVMAAEHQLRAAHADIGAARAAFFPQILLTGAYGAASTQLDQLFKSGNGVWAYGPAVALPIFDGGRNAGALKQAKAERDAAVAAYEQAVQSAFRDVADALAARRWLAGQIDSTEQSLQALTEQARLADLSYTSGRSAYLEVLEAQRALFDAQQALAQLRRAYLASGVELYAALGGGFPEAPGRSSANRP